MPGLIGLLPAIQAEKGGCMQKEKGEKALEEENDYEGTSIRGRGEEEASKVVGKSVIWNVWHIHRD